MIITLRKENQALKKLLFQKHTKEKVIEAIKVVFFSISNANIKKSNYV